MFNVVQFGISYRFRTTPFEAVEPASNPGEVLLERRLYFENNRAAAAFLRHFSTNPFAVGGFQNLLSQVGFGPRFDDQADGWIERLALTLVTGRVTVIEIVPKAIATDSVARPAERAPITPPPRRKPADPPPEQPEQSTFSVADADEEAQVQTLINAAQSGTPFCEACARAAAQAAKSSNNAQHAL